MSGCRDTNWPRSRWRKWKTARRAATDRFCPRRGAGQGLRRAAREGAPTTSRRPPNRFGRLRQIQTFSPGGIARYTFLVRILKAVASGTQLRALNSPVLDVNSFKTVDDSLGSCITK